MNSIEILPQNTRCLDYDWRLDIKIGDEIDGEDGINIWYNCTVLD